MHKVYKPYTKRPYDFVEICPSCDKAIPVLIDPDCFRYQVRCPVCNYRMMLCTLCRWDQEEEEGFDGVYKCDWNKETGCYRKKKKGR